MDEEDTRIVKLVSNTVTVTPFSSGFYYYIPFVLGKMSLLSRDCSCFATLHWFAYINSLLHLVFFVYYLLLFIVIF